MKYNELIQLYFERSNALQAYWTLYVVIVGGLLAFSSLRKLPAAVTTLIVTLLFGLFAYENLDAIMTVQNSGTPPWPQSSNLTPARRSPRSSRCAICSNRRSPPRPRARCRGRISSAICSPSWAFGHWNCGAGKTPERPPER